MTWWKPEDVRDIDFNRSFRGYNEYEVQEFLEELASQLNSMIVEREKILRENRELKRMLEENEARLVKMEEHMRKWEKQAEVEREIARKESQMVLKEAEVKAQRIIEEALERKKEIEKQHQALLEQYRLFQIRFRSLLQTFMDSLEWREKDLNTKAITEGEATEEKKEEEGGEISRFSFQDFRDDF